MENNTSLAQLLDNIDDSYMTQAEKDTAAARAQCIEFTIEAISSAFSFVKKAIFGLKANRANSSAQHA